MPILPRGRCQECEYDLATLIRTQEHPRRIPSSSATGHARAGRQLRPISFPTLRVAPPRLNLHCTGSAEGAICSDTMRTSAVRRAWARWAGNMGPQPPHTHARQFLAQAVEDHVLTRAQARRILRHYRRRAAVNGAVSIEDVALDLEKMTLEQSREVACHLLASQNGRRSLPDPFARSSLIGRREVPFATAAASLMGIVLASYWIISGSDLPKISDVASLAGLVLAILTPVSGHVAWSWVRRGLVMAATPVAAYSIWPLFAEGGMATGQAVSLGTLAVLSAAAAVMVSFQRRSVRYLNLRNEVTAQLVSRVGRRGGLSDTDAEVSSIMQTACSMIALNPWHDELRRALFWRRGVGVASLWYMIPERDADGRVVGFRMKEFAISEASNEARNLLARIQEKHHPVPLDQERYSKFLLDCSVNGRLNRKTFFASPERLKCISLSGWVYSTRQAVYEGDVRNCLAYNESYQEVLDSEQASAAALSCLSFQSVAAFVVGGRECGTEPHGVLVAFSNVRNGITSDDEKLLLVISHLLDQTLSMRTESTPATSVPATSAPTDSGRTSQYA